MPYSDNFDSALASLDAFLPDDDHELELGNTAPYADELHDRDGYSVLGPAAGLAARVRAHMGARMLSGGITDAGIRSALAAAADEEIERLQGFTGATVRGVKHDPRGKVVDRSRRPEHPRGWGDRTLRLASSFYHRLDGAGVRTYPYNGKIYVLLRD